MSDIYQGNLQKFGLGAYSAKIVRNYPGIFIWAIWFVIGTLSWIAGGVLTILNLEELTLASIVYISGFFLSAVLLGITSVFLFTERAAGCSLARATLTIAFIINELIIFTVITTLTFALWHMLYFVQIAFGVFLLSLIFKYFNLRELSLQEKTKFKQAVIDLSSKDGTSRRHAVDTIQSILNRNGIEGAASILGSVKTGV